MPARPAPQQKDTPRPMNRLSENDAARRACRKLSLLGMIGSRNGSQNPQKVSKI